MNYDDFSELAALNALALLDETDPSALEAELEEAIAQSPTVKAEFAEFQAAVAAIPYAAPLMPMAANLRTRLFERIAHAPSSPADPISHLKQKAAEVSWQPHDFPDVSIGTLHLDSEKREVAFFVRAVCGVTFPTHRHAADEEIIVLDGELTIDGTVYGVGDRIRSTPSSAHKPATASGCLLFVRTSLDDQVLT